MNDDDILIPNITAGFPSVNLNEKVDMTQREYRANIEIAKLEAKIEALEYILNQSVSARRSTALIDSISLLKQQLQEIQGNSLYD